MECGRCLRPLGGQPHPDPRGGERGQWRCRGLPGACALGGHGARGDLCRVPDCGEFPREQPHGDHHREKNKSQTVKNTRKSHRRRRELREERASSWNRFGCARSTLALNNAPFPPMLTCLNLFFLTGGDGDMAVLDLGPPGCCCGSLFTIDGTGHETGYARAGDPSAGSAHHQERHAQPQSDPGRRRRAARHDMRDL